MYHLLLVAWWDWKAVPRMSQLGTVWTGSVEQTRLIETVWRAIAFLSCLGVVTGCGRRVSRGGGGAYSDDVTAIARVFNKIGYVLLVCDLIASTRDKVTSVMESNHDSTYRDGGGDNPIPRQIKYQRYIYRTASNWINWSVEKNCIIPSCLQVWWLFLVWGIGLRHRGYAGKQDKHQLLYGMPLGRTTSFQVSFNGLIINRVLK